MEGRLKGAICQGLVHLCEPWIFTIWHYFWTKHLLHCPIFSVFLSGDMEGFLRVFGQGLVHFSEPTYGKIFCLVLYGIFGGKFKWKWPTCGEITRTDAPCYILVVWGFATNLGFTYFSTNNKACWFSFDSFIGFYHKIQHTHRSWNKI